MSTVINQQKEYVDLIMTYSDRMKNAMTKHAKKLEAIRDARQQHKQILPDFSKAALVSSTETRSNNNAVESRSTYLPPLSLVIGNKMAEELTAMPMRFEYEANEYIGVKIASAFMKIIQRTFSQTGNMSDHSLGIDHLLYGGTYIAQPIIKDLSYDLFDGESGDFKLQSGKAIGFMVYDTVAVVLDPNAQPGKVPETSEWLTVTIGQKSPEWIKRTYGVDLKIETVDSSSAYGSPKTYLTIDSYREELRDNSGLTNQTGIMVREYYKADGMVYHIINDTYVVKKHRNMAGIKGIPFAVCPCILDLDSPYGTPLPEQLRKPIELVATGINMIADNTGLKNKLPFFFPEGLIKETTRITLASGNGNKMNNYVGIDLSVLADTGQNFQAKDIRSLIQKPELQEVTQGAVTLINQGMNDIWQITGMNPTSVSGVQDTQVRVSGVADMMRGASLRNSSKVVSNIETFLLNQLTRYFQIMYYNNYDSFSELKKAGIEKKDLKNIKAVRVVNGSYLPSDQKTREEKAMFIYQLSLQNQVFSPYAVAEYIFEALGMEMERFLRNPLEIMEEEQVMRFIDDFMNKQGLGGQNGQQQAPAAPTGQSPA